jgi:adenylate kinase
MKLVFLGPPGAGKGTLADLVCENYNVLHLATGDMFRDAIKSGSELGATLQEILGKGNLVPDHITIGIMKQRLSEPDASNGYILDGFPRTIRQARALKRMQKIDAVINLEIGDDVILQRLLGRETCRNCGATYHVVNLPSKVKGVCDKCGGPLYIRQDDTSDTVANRLNVYRKQTQPLIKFYQRRGLLRNIDSSKTPEDTYHQIEIEIALL